MQQVSTRIQPANRRPVASIQPASMYCHARSPPSPPPSPTPVGASRGTCHPRACGHHRPARQRLGLHGAAEASARTARPPRRAQRRADTTTAVRASAFPAAPPCASMWVTVCWCISSLSTASRCTMPSRYVSYYARMCAQQATIGHRCQHAHILTYSGVRSPHGVVPCVHRRLQHVRQLAVARRVGRHGRTTPVP